MLHAAMELGEEVKDKFLVQTFAIESAEQLTIAQIADMVGCVRATRFCSSVLTYSMAPICVT